MIQYINNFSVNEKLKQINQLVPQYSQIKIEIKQSKNKGFGIFLLEDIDPSKILFKFDPKKTISSYQINQRLFLQSSLYKRHIQLSKIKNDNKYFQIYNNLIYHFSRIEHSLLKEELIAYPTQKQIVFYDMKPDEIKLFKLNLDYFKNQIQDRLESFNYEFEQFKKSIKLSEEQFSYFFGRDNINLQEFLYCELIVSTRTHRHSNQEILIIPIMNFANQAPVVQFNEYSITGHEFKRLKYLRMSPEAQPQLKNTEFLINYQYDSLIKYAFISGFVPTEIKYLQCLTVQFINSQQARQFNVPYQSCLNQDTIYLYFEILYSFITSDQKKKCLQKSPPFKYQNDLSPFDKSVQLWKHCIEWENNQSIKIGFDIWANVKNQIIKKKQLISDHLNEILNFIQQNTNVSQIPQLIYEYQINYLNNLENAHNLLIQFEN